VVLWRHEKRGRTVLVIVAHGVVHGAANAERSRKRYAGKIAPADSNRLRDGSVTGSLMTGPLSFHDRPFAFSDRGGVNWL